MEDYAESDWDELDDQERLAEMAMKDDPNDFDWVCAETKRQRRKVKHMYSPDQGLILRSKTERPKMYGRGPDVMQVQAVTGSGSMLPWRMPERSYIAFHKCSLWVLTTGTAAWAVRALNVSWTLQPRGVRSTDWGHRGRAGFVSSMLVTC